MKRVVKSLIIAGCIFGAVTGLAVSLSIDFMMGDALGGGWYESVKHDIDLWFGPVWAAKDWVIYISIVILIGVIGIIGGLIGSVFGAIAGKFFSLMSNPEDPV
jgi:hypothetical protein